MFEQNSPAPVTAENKPLAEKLRPSSWNDFAGLESLDKNLAEQLKSGTHKARSLILWGPAGCGKTTFAKLYGRHFDLPYVEFSAVLGGLKELREIFEAAAKRSAPTILFMDEIHRFNKAQQDAFLPHLESGMIILIGATTENPSFYLTTALLSRCQVIAFSSHTKESMQLVLARAEKETDSTFSDEARELLIDQSAGDARRLLNTIQSLTSASDQNKFDLSAVKNLLTGTTAVFYDRSGEEHYNVISAFIKSLRASNADAALYWGFRMLEAGEEPLFVIRRMIIFASEDIGNSDPRALQVAVATLQAFEAVGLPEGKIPIAQCITYLATAPKSNRSYMAMKAAQEAVRQSPKAEVPLHLRNAPTRLMKDLGYGADYKYPHDYEQKDLKDIQYLPDELHRLSFYHPSERGYEKTINERLRFLKGTNE